MSTKTSKFVNLVVKGLNKTEKDVAIEKAQRFVEDAIIDCETEISLIKTSKLPKLEGELKRAKAKLVRAEENFETARFSVAINLDAYIQVRENALDSIDSCKQEIKSIEDAIAEENAQLKSYEEILADLNA